MKTVMLVTLQTRKRSCLGLHLPGHQHCFPHMGDAAEMHSSVASRLPYLPSMMLTLPRGLITTHFCWKPKDSDLSALSAPCFPHCLHKENIKNKCFYF